MADNPLNNKNNKKEAGTFDEPVAPPVPETSDIKQDDLTYFNFPMIGQIDSNSGEKMDPQGLLLLRPNLKISDSTEQSVGGFFTRELGEKYTYRQGADFYYYKDEYRKTSFGRIINEYYAWERLPYTEAEKAEQDSGFERALDQFSDEDPKKNSQGNDLFPFQESNYTTDGATEDVNSGLVSNRYYGNKMELYEGHICETVIGDHITHVKGRHEFSTNGTIRINLSGRFTMSGHKARVRFRNGSSVSIFLEDRPAVLKFWAGAEGACSMENIATISNSAIFVNAGSKQSIMAMGDMRVIGALVMDMQGPACNFKTEAELSVSALDMRATGNDMKWGQAIKSFLISQIATSMPILKEKQDAMMEFVGKNRATYTKLTNCL